MATAGEPFYFTMPRIVNVCLKGQLPPFISAKNVILEVLRRISVKGGLNAILEYTGEGIRTLNVTERSAICNMGAETGATTSLFPSDEATRHWLRAQGREKDWMQILPDEDALYDDVIDRLGKRVAQGMESTTSRCGLPSLCPHLVVLGGLFGVRLDHPARVRILEKLAVVLVLDEEVHDLVCPRLDLMETLESHGVKVFEVEAPESFDGFSGWADDRPIVVLAKWLDRDVPRKRFTALHKIAHVLIHPHSDVPETDREKVCHRFAGAILMPREVFEADWGGAPSPRQHGGTQGPKTALRNFHRGHHTQGPGFGPDRPGSIP
jgi:hypothetical protein